MARTRRVHLFLGLLCLGALCSAPARAGDGSFATSDPLLDRIWQVSVQTARDMVVPGPLATDANGNPCLVRLRTVIVDGLPRDRCVFVGDTAVTGATLEVSTPSALPAVRSMLAFFAAAQLPSGAIPASPQLRESLLFDYNAYWVQAVHDYVLYSGDMAFAKQMWPTLARLVDRWYPAQAQAGGLLARGAATGNYSYFPSTQPVVAYFNAQYALALGQAAELAGWEGHGAAGKRWLGRKAALVAPFQRAFWDAFVGAYRDSPTGPLVHPQDGNAFAVLSGLASPTRGRAALDYIGHTDYRAYGNTIADSDAWDNATMAGTSSREVVYPFMSYFEVLARFAAGQAGSAFDLIRREWGYMLANGPQKGMWELIGPFGSAPPGWASWDHGWSSGAAPALSDYVLDVRPTSPGFRTFVVEPNPGDLAWAKGSVPTPYGDIHVSWSTGGGKLRLSVTAPPGTARRR